MSGMRTIFSTLLLLLAAEYVKGQIASLEWAYGIGDFRTDVAHTVAVDSLGNYYICGSFRETVDFDPSETGTFELTSAGLYDIFIAKFNPDGDFLTAWQIGGPGSEGVIILPLGGGGDVKSILNIDADGNIYLTCIVAGDCDIDPGSGTTVIGDPSIIYYGFSVVLKMDSGGNLLWHVAYGPGELGVEGSCLDLEGNIYLSGWYGDTLDFNPSPLESYELNPNPVGSSRSQYLLKLNTDGQFLWAGSLPALPSSSSSCQPVSTHERVAITTDLNNDLLVAGSFNSSAGFELPDDTFNLVAVGCSDIYVMKLSPSGEPIWIDHMVGQDSSALCGTSSIVSDKHDNVYLVGVMFNGGIDFNSGNASFVLDRVGGYLLKLNPDGLFHWVLDHGPHSSPLYRSVTVDSNQNPWVTGVSGTYMVTYIGNDSTVVESDGWTTVMIKADSSGVFQWAGGFGNNLQSSNGEITYYTYWDVKSDLEGGVVASSSFRDTVDVGLGPVQYLLPGDILSNKNACILKIDNPLVSVATEEGAIESGAMIYPNPTTDGFYVRFNNQCGQARYTLTGIDGILVSDGLIKGLERVEISPSVSKGMYLVRVDACNNHYTFKLIIQ